MVSKTMGHFRRSTLGTHAHKEYSAYLTNFVPRGYDELDLCITTVILVLVFIDVLKTTYGKVSFVNTSTLLMHKAYGCDY
jgi:aminopeptidase-like protein